MKTLVRIGCLGFSVGCWALLISMFTGCTYLAGPKRTEKRADGTEITDYITGADFGISFNGVDTVENHRGIKPGSN